MNDKAQFAQRLAQAMTDAGYPAKAAVLEREFNQRYLGRPVTLQAVCRWMNGEALPTQEKLMVLADWLGVNAQYLRYGDIAFSVRETKADWHVPGRVLNPYERELVEALLALPAAQQKTVREIILAFQKPGAAQPGIN